MPSGIRAEISIDALQIGTRSGLIGQVTTVRAVLAEGGPT